MRLAAVDRMRAGRMSFGGRLETMLAGFRLSVGATEQGYVGLEMKVDFAVLWLRLLIDGRPV